MPVFKGTVTKTNRKDGTGKNGKAYSLYSAQISGFDKYLNFKFKDPGVKQGDVLEVDGDFNGDRGFDVTRHRVLGHEEVPQAQASSPASSGGGGGSRDDYWANKEKYDREHTQPRIQYQSARKDALEFLNILAAQDALPITASTGKANKAKRFEELKDILDKLTVEFANDITTLRVFDKVADAGVVGARASQPLPTAEPASEDEEPEESWEPKQTIDGDSWE